MQQGTVATVTITETYKSQNKITTLTSYLDDLDTI